MVKIRMSYMIKRKYVFKEVFDDDVSLPTEKQMIVKILGTKGNNLHQVLAPDQSTFLVSMPRKFRKNIWVSRGCYVLVEPIEEGDKVKAEIVSILTNEHIQSYKADKVWPPEFDDQKRDIVARDEEDFLVNTNRLHLYVNNESSSCSCSSSSSEESD